MRLRIRYPFDATLGQRVILNVMVISSISNRGYKIFTFSRSVNAKSGVEFHHSTRNVSYPGRNGETECFETRFFLSSTEENADDSMKLKKILSYASYYKLTL